PAVRGARLGCPWQLRDGLGKVDLDADFIETIRGETRWSCLAALLEDSDAAAWIAREHRRGHLGADLRGGARWLGGDAVLDPTPALPQRLRGASRIAEVRACAGERASCEPGRRLRAPETDLPDSQTPAGVIPHADTGAAPVRGGSPPSRSRSGLRRSRRGSPGEASGHRTGEVTPPVTRPAG